MIPPDSPNPPNPPEPTTSPSPPSDSTDSTERPGASTFTIEGRAAPALFVVGWLATIVGLGAVAVALLSGNEVAPILLIAGLVVLAVGLVAGAGSQGIERRASGLLAYQGPSPLLVFAASVPISLIAVVVLGVPLALLGVEVDGPIGRLLSVAAQALIYAGLVRLLVVDTGALTWAEMGIRRPDGRALTELLGGALWAAPVILLTVPIAALMAALFPVTPVSPLPPTGETSGFAIQLVAGAVIAPIGEEILFRGLATTAWVQALGARAGLVRGALFFAAVHVLTISGSTAGEAVSLAVVGFATRIPVALVLGWLFLRRGSIWAPIGLHAAFNALLLILGEMAFRAGAAG